MPACGKQPDEHRCLRGLLLDVLEGDHSLFLRYDEVDWAWRVVDPVLKVWSMERDFIHTYPAGSWGPEEANRLFIREDQDWRKRRRRSGGPVLAFNQGSRANRKPSMFSRVSGAKCARTKVRIESAGLLKAPPRATRLEQSPESRARPSSRVPWSLAR
jgi:hypothetical protein